MDDADDADLDDDNDLEDLGGDNDDAAPAAEMPRTQGEQRELAKRRFQKYTSIFFGCARIQGTLNSTLKMASCGAPTAKYV